MLTTPEKYPNVTTTNIEDPNFNSLLAGTPRWLLSFNPQQPPSLPRQTQRLCEGPFQRQERTAALILIALPLSPCAAKDTFTNAAATSYSESIQIPLRAVLTPYQSVSPLWAPTSVNIVVLMMAAIQGQWADGLGATLSYLQVCAHP